MVQRLRYRAIHRQDRGRHAGQRPCARQRRPDGRCRSAARCAQQRGARHLQDRRRRARARSRGGLLRGEHGDAPRLLSATSERGGLHLDAARHAGARSFRPRHQGPHAARRRAMPSCGPTAASTALARRCTSAPCCATTPAARCQPAADAAPGPARRHRGRRSCTPDLGRPAAGRSTSTCRTMPIRATGPSGPAPAAPSTSAASTVSVAGLRAAAARSQGRTAGRRRRGRRRRSCRPCRPTISMAAPAPISADRSRRRSSQPTKPFEDLDGLSVRSRAGAVPAEGARRAELHHGRQGQRRGHASRPSDSPTAPGRSRSRCTPPSTTSTAGRPPPRSTVAAAYGRPLHRPASPTATTCRTAPTPTFDVALVDGDGKPLGAESLKWDLVKEDYDYTYFYRDGRWQSEEAVNDTRVNGGDLALGADGRGHVTAQVTNGRWRLEAYDAVGQDGDEPPLRRRLVVGQSRPRPQSPKPSRSRSTRTRRPARSAPWSSPSFAGPRAGDARRQRPASACRKSRCRRAAAPVEFDAADVPASGAYVVAVAISPSGAVLPRLPVRAVGLAWVPGAAAAHQLDVAIDGAGQDRAQDAARRDARRAGSGRRSGGLRDARRRRRGGAADDRFRHAGPGRPLSRQARARLRTARRLRQPHRSGRTDGATWSRAATPAPSFRWAASTSRLSRRWRCSKGR